MAEPLSECLIIGYHNVRGALANDCDAFMCNPSQLYRAPLLFDSTTNHLDLIIQLIDAPSDDISAEKLLLFRGTAIRQEVQNERYHFIGNDQIV